jgi:NTP pyrophosphatase (non-canonical NTP hydrolase)
MIPQKQPMQNVDDYQDKIKQFVIYPRESAYSYLALGLSSEAGEVAGVIKKIIRDSDGSFSDESRLSLLKELGDVVWYIASLASEIGVDMSEILAENYHKLELRAQRGVLGGSGDNR